MTRVLTVMGTTLGAVLDGVPAPGARQDVVAGRSGAKGVS